MSHGNGWRSTSSKLSLNTRVTVCVCERVSQLTSDRDYSSFESESIPVTPSTNVTIQVAWGRLSILGVKAPWVSSLTSSSKRYCTSNVVSHDPVGMCTKNTLSPPWIRWHLSRKTIPDNRLAPTFYKLSLGRCPHQHSLSVTVTWAISIGITCCIDIHRSVWTTSNRNQVAFCRCIHFYKQSFFVTDHECGFLPTLPENGFYEDHTTLVVNLEGARQKIIIHQVFNTSVKVWSRCECYLGKKFLVKNGEINRIINNSVTRVFRTGWHKFFWED